LTTKLKLVRQSRHIMQKEAAARAGIKPAVYQHYESGFHPLGRAKISTVRRICKALKCKIDDII
jgi:transcriptional regulator with XRE-family HTH domain